MFQADKQILLGGIGIFSGANGILRGQVQVLPYDLLYYVVVNRSIETHCRLYCTVILVCLIRYKIQERRVKAQSWPL